MNVSMYIICVVRGVVIYGKLYCHFDVLCSDMCLTIYHITVKTQNFEMFFDSMNIIYGIVGNVKYKR